MQRKIMPHIPQPKITLFKTHSITQCHDKAENSQVSWSGGEKVIRWSGAGNFGVPLGENGVSGNFWGYIKGTMHGGGSAPSCCAIAFSEIVT